MCDLCLAGQQKIGPIDQRDAFRIVSDALRSASASGGLRPRADDDPSYQPFGQPADGYALALNRPTTPIVKDASGTPDPYASDVADDLCEQEAGAGLHDEGYAAAPAHDGVGGKSDNRERGRQQDQQCRNEPTRLSYWSMPMSRSDNFISRLRPQCRTAAALTVPTQREQDSRGHSSCPSLQSRERKGRGAGTRSSPS